MNNYTDLTLGELHGSHISGNHIDGYIVEGINGNNIAVFDAFTTGMVFEADMELLSDMWVAGLAFGIGSADAKTIGNDWSAFHFLPTRGNAARVFSKKNLNTFCGLDSGKIALSDKISSNKVRLKISIDKENQLCAFVDDMDTPVYTCKLEGYIGGYVGFCTSRTSAKFTNIKLKGAEFPTITSVAVDGEKENEIVSDFGKTYVVDSDTKIKLRVTLDTGSYMVENQIYESGQLSDEITLQDGFNTINIAVLSESGDIRHNAARVNVIRPICRETAYEEAFRPQFHFSPRDFWCNDPNGMVYNAHTGEFHMFYQYNPTVLFHDGQSHWGHAVSKDLVHWTELPIALYPDDVGIIASGSGVIDYHNTSGLFDDSTPPASRMVLIFTYFATGKKPGKGGLQRQAIAYSTDHGYTWTKYAGNPVIANMNDEYSLDFRDPKVMWMEETGLWLMIVAGSHARMFTSPDLIHWTHNSNLIYANGDPIDSECPELFPLAVDGDKNNIKWVYSGCGKFYVIGDLVFEDRRYVFKAQSDKIDFFHKEKKFLGDGTQYASQSFGNMPDGRTVLVNWTVTNDAEHLKRYKKTWNGNLSIPMEAKLVTQNGKILLTVEPIAELEALRSAEPIFSASNLTVNPSDRILKGLKGRLLDIEATISLNDASEFGFELHQKDGDKVVVKYTVDTQQLTVDKSTSSVYATDVLKIKSVPVNNKVQLRILLDSSLIDVFSNHGLERINTLCYTDPTAEEMTFYTLGGSVTIDALRIYSMRSSWIKENIVDIVPLLTRIELSDGELLPAYHPMQNEYSIVGCHTESLDITPVFADATSVHAYINGEEVSLGETKTISCSDKESKVFITLTDKTGRNIYTLHIPRKN